MICADAELTRLDEQLGTVYKQATGQAADRDLLKKQQLDWLRQVRNPCPTVACLTEAYRQRISALQQPAFPSPFPATYVGGFTGKETLVFSQDGRVTEGNTVGRQQIDHASFWPDARYPILIQQQVDGKTQERHCKIQPDMRKMFCNEGGSLSSEFDRQGPPPAVVAPVAKKCDEEQIYLDVMAAARRARPDMDLKGSTELTQDAQKKCHITLYYLKDGQAVDVQATYALDVHPLKLILVDTPPHKP
ncbi:MAG: DUF1311 domain-containing protein [Magnetococcales bacterium]|nr:DUF1311 domain-containing protein [Magnetococcales bacterium]